MGERRGTKGLELWCRRMTEGYPGVKIDNMTTSWRDGLAFCAIIHHFRPDLIDFSTLKKNDVYYNNDLAFTVAEKYLGIPALLEAADMVQYDVPDRLSILTYLSQFYRAFVASQGTSPSRTVPKRPASASDRGIVSPASTSPPTKMAVKSGGMPRRDPCAKCGLPVFIAERLSVGKLLYHRTCFRCARCNSQLTLANYYETETQNQFCCETCPDEETKNEKAKIEVKSIVARSLSDEEKSASLNKADEANDDYSTLFETALENPDDPSLAKSGTLSSVKSSEFTKARSHFFSSQIENSESDEEMPPELPKTKPPDIKSELPKLERLGRSETAVPKDLSDSYNVNKANYESNSGLTSNTHSLDSDVYISAKININNQLKAASVQLGKSNDFVTKEIQSTKEESPSLVKTRSRLFEKPTTISKKPLKNTPTVETPLNLFKTSPLRAKFSQSTSNIFTADNPTSPPVPKSPVQKYNFDRRRSLTEVTSAFTEKLTRPEKKEPASLRANSPIAKRVQSLTSIFQKQSPEKRKSSPLPEKRTTETPLKLSQKSPPIVSTISKPGTALRTTSSENSLNTLLERQLSKKLKTSSSDLTKMAEGEPPKPESPQLQKKPLAIYRPKNQTDISDPTPTKNFSLKSGEMSPTLRSQTKRRESKTILSKERDQEKFVSVSALKNLFENTRSEVNKPLDNPELIIEVDGPKGVKVVTLETVNASIDSDINNFSEHPQVAIAEALGNENINQNDESPNERVTANHYNKPDVTAVDSLENIVPFPQEKEEEVDDTEIKDIALDDIQTRSDNSSNSVVDLINISVSEIIELKHTDKEITSHPDNDEIVDDSEDIPHAIEETTSQSIKSDVIMISDDAIEISDDSIPVSAIPDESIPVIEISDESSANNKTNEEYPEDLNPFDDGGGDLATNHTQKSLNPFDEDVEEQEILTASPKPAARKKFSARSEMQHTVNKEDRSLNPFDCEEDDEQLVNKKEELPRSPKPAARKLIHPIELENIIESPISASNTISINPNDEFISPHPIGTEQRRQLKVISASHISLNPFLSDDEGEEIEDNSKPVPKPRKSKNTPFTPEPKPRTSGRSVVSSSHGSSTSISSANSSGQTVRKKKPAPRPPAFVSEISESGHSSLTSSPSTSVQHSPRSTPKTRKIRKAPPPPTSTPYLTAAEPSLNFSSICDKESSQENLATLQAENFVNSDEWEKEKIVKDEVNRNRQSQYFSPSSPTLSQKDYTPNKSTYGMWKRKKGPAPSRPVPQRRLIKALPTTEIRRELDVIELQQQGLEKQGVRLEQIIRDRCEGPENSIDDSVPIDVEDLILQLFEVVNEKNELCRKQAELMYLQRQQRLEEEHADVEYQIRCLMLQPEANKTDSDKAREEELINRLVDIVERRNEIIECLEMDRIREAEEDDSICNSLNTYASKRDENVKSEPEILSKKEKKKTKKEKKNKLKNAQIADDIDKDVDESETFYVAPSKDKKKKKFALF